MSPTGRKDCANQYIDFPVMPAEKFVIAMKPVNFFHQNPSNDVPRSNQRDNSSTLHTSETASCCPSSYV